MCNRRCFAFPAFFLFGAVCTAAEPSGVISAPCPFSCRSAGLPATHCRDWRINDTCYVEKIEPDKPKPLIICMQKGGVLKARRRCRKKETPLSPELIRGPQGEQGPQGEDGSYRIYGDGSAGDRLISGNVTFSDSQQQYDNFTIQPGAVLSVFPGTVIRCRGNFRNSGTIIVNASFKSSPKFADNGEAPTEGPYQSSEAAGGSGGSALPQGVARVLLRPGLLSGGNGSLSSDGAAGSLGGGSLAVVCRGRISNEGEIRANAQDAAVGASGGGGGGMIVLASFSEVANRGVINANGGNGSNLIPNDGHTGRAAGGGGGGGIVHLIAPSVENSGTINVRGGNGGAAGDPGSLSAQFKVGGCGGGGSGGAGGAGGTANPADVGNGSSTAGEPGQNGMVLVTETDPTALF